MQRWFTCGHVPFLAGLKLRLQALQVALKASASDSVKYSTASLQVSTEGEGLVDVKTDTLNELLARVRSYTRTNISIHGSSVGLTKYTP